MRVLESHFRACAVYRFLVVALEAALLPAPSVPLIFLVPTAFFSGFPVTVPSIFLPTPLTLVPTDVFFAGTFLVLVTPVGLLALTVVAFFGPLFAPVLAVARFLVVAVVVSVTVGKTLGRELPVAERVPSRAIASVVV